jgi:hypothetical protein
MVDIPEDGPELPEDGPALEVGLAQDHPPKPASKPHKMLQICVRLSVLSRWQIQGASISHSLCDSIERSINFVFDPANECTLTPNAAKLLEFSWRAMTCKRKKKTLRKFDF